MDCQLWLSPSWEPTLGRGLIHLPPLSAWFSLQYEWAAEVIVQLSVWVQESLWILFTLSSVLSIMATTSHMWLFIYFFIEKIIFIYLFKMFF